MKHLVLSLVLILTPVCLRSQMLQVIVAGGTGSGGGGGTCGGNGFTSCKTLTISSSQITGTLTDFPMLVSDTDTTLKSTGSGGTVTDGQGDDIVFTSDSACTTLLSWEPLELWTSGSGAIIAHVKVPSAAVGTSIYRCSGKGAITTFQGGSAGAAWDSDFVAVYHLPDGSSLTLGDVTSNAYTATNSSATATTGKIDGGMSTASSKFITSPTITSMSTALTWSAWINTSSSGSFQMIVSNITAAQNELRLNTSNFAEFVFGGNLGVGTTFVTGSTNLADGMWHHLAGTFRTIGSGGDGKIRLYVDGALIGTGASATDFPAAITNFVVGGRQADNSYPLTGTIDEQRTSKTDRSAAWIGAEYNNQSSPSSFYTVN